jgi:4-amino-4-deoxy-L-arabinose transferase-like glycosyltransferase
VIGVIYDRLLRGNSAASRHDGDSQPLTPQNESGHTETPVSRTTRLQRILVGIVIVSALLLYVARLEHFQLGTFLDEGNYIVTARSIASGQGYSQISHPDAPPESKYPPGFPVILSPLALLFPDSLTALRIPALLFTLASLPVWFAVLRRRLPFPLAILAILAVATNHYVVLHSAAVMSEAAFLFFSGLLFMVVDRLPDRSRSTFAKGFAISAILVILYFLRTIGVVFVPATVIYLLLRRQFRLAGLVVCLFAIPFAAWGYRNITVTQSLVAPSYAQELTMDNNQGDASLTGIEGLLRRVGFTASHYTWYVVPESLSLNPKGEWPPNALVRISDQVGISWLPGFLGGIVTSVIILGPLVRLRRGEEFVPLIVVFYFGSLLLWTWSAPRFVHPLSPLIYLAIIDGCRLLLSRLRVLWGTRVNTYGFLVVILVGLTLMNLTREIRILVDNERSRTWQFTVGSEWLAENLPEDAVVMTEKPLLRYLFAKRKMIDYPVLSEDRRLTADDILRSRADHVLIAPPAPALRSTGHYQQTQELKDLFATHPENFRLIVDKPEDLVQVYQILR